MANSFDMIKGRLGFASYAVRGGFDQILKFAGEHGFDLVQIGMDSNRYFPESVEADERGRVSRMFAENDIQLCFHGPSDLPLMNRHDAIRSAALTRYYEMIDLAVDLGGIYFVIHPGRLAFYSVSKKEIIFMDRKIPSLHVGLFEDSLLKLLEYSKGRITLCMENTYALPYPFLNVVSRLAVENGLGLVWDAGHTELAAPAARERTIKFFQDNIGRVRLAHLHDVSEGADHKELGTGEVNIDGYLEIFNTIGVDIILEIFPEDKLLKSVEYLKRLQLAET